MLYLDTSLVVSATIIEAETRRVQDWLRERVRDAIGFSWWTTAEYSAALSIKLRLRTLTLAEREIAYETLAGLMGSVAYVPIMFDDYRRAAQLADEYALGLRAGDALHLAVAARIGATLCTLDRGQAEAGAPLGISTVLV